MSGGIVLWRKGHLHVGWRREDWTDVWYRPIENGTFDQEFDFGFYTNARQGEKSSTDLFRQPVEPEIAWRPHFDSIFNEANTRKARRDIQRRLLTDVHQYVNGDAEVAKVRAVEKDAVDGRNIRKRMIFADAVRVRMKLEKKAKERKARANANNMRDEDDSTYNSTDSSDSGNDAPATYVNRNAPVSGSKQKQKPRPILVRRRRVTTDDSNRPLRRRRVGNDVSDDVDEGGVFMSGAIRTTTPLQEANFVGVEENGPNSSGSQQASQSPSSFATPLLPRLGTSTTHSHHLNREGSDLFMMGSGSNHRVRTSSQLNSHRPSPVQHPNAFASQSHANEDTYTQKDSGGTSGMESFRYQPYVADEDDEDEQMDRVIKDSIASANQSQVERTAREASLAHIQPDDMDEDAAFAEATRRSLAPTSSLVAWDFSNLPREVEARDGDNTGSRSKRSDGVEGGEYESPATNEQQ
ncbi:hypothetical protein K431DRAFT_342541 [Polychaeton citri CBS 116435]|uniref:Uncharacterized protein n=1 Tax=Polychaeton citri CBS 116435 TaxID=1314669 RepID=A0A9P4QFH2_9PEZI|nr:hypothetical protein K431DRAFT_342541 [Polychaeton citri CBS 116435]